MADTMLLIPVRTSRQGTSLNAGKLKEAYKDETSTVEMHGDDMARLGLKPGDRIRIASANGAEAEVTCKAQKGGQASPGLVFMAYGPVSSRFMEADTAGTGMPISKQMEITVEGPLAEDGSVIAVAPTATAAVGGLAASPLTPEQSALINSLTPQLSASQAIWLSGYFAALSGSALGAGLDFGAAGGVGTAANLPLMTVLFGSETGNGEGLANKLFAQAQARGFNVRLKDMVDYDESELDNEKLLFIIVSTQGEGDPPLTALKLHNVLKGEHNLSLGELKYGVFALGDSSYEFFCQTGKNFDAFLETAGAERVLDRIDADTDFEDVAEEWMESVLDYYQSEAEKAGAGLPAAGAGGVAAGQDSSGYSKTNPYPAEIKVNDNLNAEGSAKETRHIEIDLGDSGLEYKPGDALGVYPLNNAQYVDALLTALKMDGEQSVTVAKQNLSLRDALIQKLDITALSRVLMEKYAALIGSDALGVLLSEENNEQFKEYIWGRQILDLVEDYPAEGVTPQQFVDTLRKMPARLYSIASSLTAHPGEVHLLVGAVRYHSFDRDREGVCSTFLAGRVATGERIAVYVQPNKHFHLPADPETPIIMVGPGTGLAPFRAFLEERKAADAAGKNWLFFGDQHEASDFLYSEELTRMHEDGFLTNLSLAFSRDQEQKIYVQHRILERSAEIWEWLQQGAYFYICGDAERMANDVHNALIETAVKEGGLDSEAAERYVNDLLESRRYQRDVY